MSWVIENGYVKIKVSRDSTNNSLQLEFTQSSPSQLKPLFYKRTLFLTEKGHFIPIQERADTVPEFSSEIFKSNVATLTFPGLEGTLTLQSDGVLILGKMIAKTHLMLSTNNSIIVDEAVETHGLTLFGNNIKIHNSINAKGIILQAEKRIDNQHCLHADYIQMMGTGHFNNLGLASATNELHIGIRSIDNKGALLAKHCVIQAIGKGAEPIYFNNSGLIYGTETTSLHFSGDFNNEVSGKIFCSAGDVTIIVGNKFYNAAHIYSGSKLFIDTQSALNTGALFGQKGLMINSADILTNVGEMRSLLSLSARSNAFYNGRGGCMLAGTLLAVTGNKKFYNSARLEGKELVKVGSNATIINARTGKILCKKAVEIIGLQDLCSYGEVSGHQSVSAQTLGDIRNLESAKITGEKLTLSTLATLTDEGLIGAEQFLKVKANGLYVGKNAVLHSAGHADITVHHTATISGTLSAQNLNLEAESLINQLLTGNIESLDALTLKIRKKMENASRIHAAGKMDISVGGILHNTASGVIEAERRLRVTALQVNNFGVFKAHRLFLSVALNLCNSPTAQLVATQCLELLSQGTIENEGKITCEESILLQAVEKISNKLDGVIKAEQWIRLINTFQVENAASIVSHGDLLIEALQEFTNLAEGHVLGDKIAIKSTLAHNAGTISATQSIHIEAKLILNNLLQGLISAGETLELFSKNVLENSGKLSSQGRLLLKSDDILKNLKTGEVVSAQDLELLAGHVLSNAGVLFGNKDVLIKSGKWFTNLLEATIHSQHALNVEAYRLDNEGTMDSGTTLTLTALKILRNHQHGKLKSAEAMSAIADILDNMGSIDSIKTLFLEATLILTNFREGKIAAKEALQLCSACIVNNTGKVQSAKDITVKSEALLQTLAGSRMDAQDQLTVLSKFAIENASLLIADRIHLEATSLFNNLLEGEISAKTAVSANGQYVKNQGDYRSQGDSLLHCQTLQNLGSGKITAANALDIFAKSHIANQGTIASANTKVESVSLINTGTLAGLKTLLVNIKDTFEHCREGILVAEEAIVVLAEHLRLLGQMIAKGDLEITTGADFEYNSETLMACGLLKLMLKQGCSFDKLITTPGSLSVQTPSDIHVCAPIKSGKNFDMTARNIFVEKDGIFSDEKFIAEAAQLLQTGEGTYLGSQGDMHLKANTFRNVRGEVFVQQDLLLQALALVENNGNIGVNGNAKIIAPLIQHRQLKNTSSKPVLSVAKDCTLQGNTVAYDAELCVGGKFTPLGTFQIGSTEADAARRKYEEEFARACKKAKRKKKRKIIKNFAGLVVSGIVAPFSVGCLAKLMGSTGLFAAGTFSSTVANGMSFGAISSRIAGNSALKGAMQGGIFSGFGYTANFVITVESEALRAALIAGSTGSLHTVINGGNFIQNTVLSAGASAVSHLMLPVHEMDSMHTLSTDEILRDVGEATGRTIIAGGVTSLVNKSSLGDNLVAALMGAAQAFSGALGHNARLSLEDAPDLTSTLINREASKEPESDHPPKPKKIVPTRQVNKSNDFFEEILTNRENTRPPKARQIVSTAQTNKDNHSVEKRLQDRESGRSVKLNRAVPTRSMGLSRGLEMTFPSVSEELRRFYKPSYNTSAGLRFNSGGLWNEPITQQNQVSRRFSAPPSHSRLVNNGITAQFTVRSIGLSRGLEVTFPSVSEELRRFYKPSYNTGAGLRFNSGGLWNEPITQQNKISRVMDVPSSHAKLVDSDFNCKLRFVHQQTSHLSLGSKLDCLLTHTSSRFGIASTQDNILNTNAKSLLWCAPKFRTSDSSFSTQNTTEHYSNQSKSSHSHYYLDTFKQGTSQVISPLSIFFGEAQVSKLPAFNCEQNTRALISMQPERETSIGEKILNFIFPAAEASPLIWPAAAGAVGAGSGMGVGLCNNRTQQRNEEGSNIGYQQSDVMEYEEKPLFWESSKHQIAKAQIRGKVFEDIQEHIDKKGCGVIKKMSNDQVVQACVDLADKSHTAAELLFDFNPVSNAKGIYRHTTAAKCLREVQEQCRDDRNIKIEQSWRNGIELGTDAPKLGSVRLDARDTMNNVVYDYKFGQATLERPQVENIQRHVPDDPTTLVVKEVLTTERGGITTKAVGSTFKGSK